MGNLKDPYVTHGVYGTGGVAGVAGGQTVFLVVLVKILDDLTHSRERKVRGIDRKNSTTLHVIWRVREYCKRIVQGGDIPISVAWNTWSDKAQATRYIPLAWYREYRCLMEKMRSGGVW